MTGTPEPTDDELRAAVQRALSEPVDVDVARRAAAIAAALDAAGGTDAADDDTTVTPLAPRRSPRINRPLLVAASILAVLAVGTLALLSGDGGSDQLATGSGDEGGVALDEAAEFDEPRLMEEDAAVEHEGAAPPAEEGEEVAPSPTTTVAPAAPLVDLGEHDRLRDVLSAAREMSPESTEARGELGGSSLPEPSTCELQLLAQGWTPIATATVRSSPVFVAVNGEGSPMVVDADSCRPYDAP